MCKASGGWCFIANVKKKRKHFFSFTTNYVIFSCYIISMQIDQLFEFVYILIDKKQVTAKEMSEYFGVSTRTVYRWIAALSVSGVPIYSLKGR